MPRGCQTKGHTGRDGGGGGALHPWPSPKGKGSHEKHPWCFQTHGSPMLRHLLQCMGDEEVFPRDATHCGAAPALGHTSWLVSLKGSQWVLGF